MLVGVAAVPGPRAPGEEHGAAVDHAVLLQVLQECLAARLRQPDDPGHPGILLRRVPQPAAAAAQHQQPHPATRGRRRRQRGRGRNRGSAP